MSWSILKQVRHAGAKGAPARRGKTSSKLTVDYIATAAAKGCSACPLDKADLQHPKMAPTGAAPRDAEIYILGEAPGREEDEQGTQFVGASGRVLRREIPTKWDERIRWNNTIRCRPPANRDPAVIELECCRKQQVQDIVRSKPKLILGFGNVPLSWLLPGAGLISAWRGRLVPVVVGGHACWFMPITHPAYLLHASKQKNGAAIEDAFRADVARAFDLLDSGALDAPPTVASAADKNEGVVLLRTLKQIQAAFEEAATWDDYGIDIETNGLSPYRNDARILTVSVSNYDKTFCAPIRHRGAKFDEKTWRAVEKVVEHLLLNGGKPIAHNSKFEQTWLLRRFGPRILYEVDWQDTMAQAYVLDEREGAKSLEAVSMLRLGLDVKSLSRPLRMDDLDSEPLDDVLHYNGYDAKYVVPVYHLQHEALEQEKLLSVYEMHTRRSVMLSMMEAKGVLPDTAQAAEFDKEYEQKVIELDAQIQALPDVKRFMKQEGRRFSAGSTKDLLDLLHGMLKFKQCEVKERNNKTRFSTEEDVLKQIDHPVSKLTLDRRSAIKMRSTYIVPLCKGGKYIADDGLVHANFKHLVVATGRTACEDPNLQNFPRRKDRQLRRMIVAPDKHWMIAADYGQIEARVIACAARCPVLIAALWEGYDIHGEEAERIAHAYPARIGGKKFLNDKAVMKELRDVTKNGWTFPLFYGSALESVAENMGVPVNKIAPLYDEFWEKFSAVKDWQETLRKSYRKNQYVEALTLRRRHAPLSWNEIINSGIQGAASDIVVDAGCAIGRKAYELDLPQLHPVIDVHDDLTYYLPDKTLERDLDLITQEMVRPRYSWICVPLIVEVKAGKNWCDLEEIAVVSSTEFGHKRKEVR